MAWLLKSAVALSVAVSLLGGVANAADVPVKTFQAPAPAGSGWEFKFSPYAWLVFDKGDLGLGNKTSPIDTNIFKILGEVKNIYAWMSYQELRKGPFAIYANVFWSRMSFSDTKSGVLPIGRFIDASAVAQAKIWTDLAIIEPGVTYEFARWTSGASWTALEALAGARYWYIKPDITLDVTATVSIPALNLSKTTSGTVSAAKTIDWIDPIVGMRVRHVVAPGKELMLQGDVGGFGVGSNFTWQAIATYNFETEFAGYKLKPFIGYRAISIDYEQGSGRRALALDLIQHGPVMGLTFTW